MSRKIRMMRVIPPGTRVKFSYGRTGTVENVYISHGSLRYTIHQNGSESGATAMGMPCEVEINEDFRPDEIKPIDPPRKSSRARKGRK